MAMYSLDGVDLDDERRRWVLSSETSLGTRGEPWNVSVDIPNRFGILPIAPRVTKSSQVVLKFTVFSWADGRNGNLCKGGLNQLEFNLRALLGHLMTFGKMRQLGYTPQGNLLKVADVRLTGTLEPKIDPEAEIATLSAVFEVASGLWRDPEPTVVDLSDTSALNGGNMPIPDAWLILRPTANSCSLTDEVSGSSVSWNGTLTGAERLLIDVAGYRCWSIDADQWSLTAQHKARDAEFSQSPGGFVIRPDVSGAIHLKADSCTGYVRARRSY